jgi:hypothetical protein
MNSKAKVTSTERQGSHAFGNCSHYIWESSVEVSIEDGRRSSFINAELLEDEYGDAIRVSFPEELWGDQVKGNSIDVGVVVGLQAWLLPKRSTHGEVNDHKWNSSDPVETEEEEMWLAGLCTHPRVVVLAPTGKGYSDDGITDKSYPGDRVLSAEVLSRRPSVLKSQKNPVLVMWYASVSLSAFCKTSNL